MANNLELFLRIAVKSAGEDRIAAIAAALRTMGIEADKAEELARGLAGELDGVAKEADQAGGSLVNMENALKGLLTGAALNQLAEMSDRWKQVNTRLRLATEGQEEYGQAQEEVFRISQQTFTALDATATLYQRIDQSLEELGGTQQQVADLTDLVNKTFRINNSNAQETASSIRQLAQALGSGVLRGDEFNSVMENNARLAKALADGLGVPIGRLREMAEAGELTTQKITQALLAQKRAIDTEFSQVAPTIGAALQKVENAWTKFIGELDESKGVSAGVVATLGELAENFQEVADLAVIAGEAILAAYAVKGVQAVTAYSLALAKNVADTYAKVAADKQAAATAIEAARAEEVVAAATLANARAKTTAAAATIAEAEAHLVNVKNMAIYGETRAAAERQVTAAKLAGVQATNALAIAERNLQAAQANAAAATMAASRSAGVLGATLGLLGGPAGAVALATGAILLFASSQGKASESVDQLNTKLEQQGRRLDELSAKQLKVYISDLEKTIDAAKREQDVAKARLETMDRQRGGFGDLKERQEKYNRLLAEEESATAKVVELERQRADALARMAKLTEAAANANEVYAISTEQMAEEIRNQVAVLDEKNKTAKVEAEIAARVIDQQILEKRHAAELAKRKGDENEARRLNREAIELEAEELELKAELDIAEAGRLLQKAELIRTEAEVRGELTGETKAQIDTLIANAKALAQNAQFLRAAAAAQRDLADNTGDAIQQYERHAKAVADVQLAEAEAASARVEQVQSLGSLQGSIDDFHEHLKGLGDAMAFHINSAREGMRELTNDSELALAEFERFAKGGASVAATIGDAIGAYYNARKYVVEKYQAEFEVALEVTDRLAENLDTKLGGSLAATIQHAEQVAASIKFLDQETLDNLTAAISDAKERMQELADASKDTLQAVEEEYLRVTGRMAELARLQAEEALAALRIKLEEAKAAGNQEAIRALERALALQKQINAEKIKEAELNEKAKREREGGTTTTNRGDRSGGVQSNAGTPGSVNLTINVTGPSDPDGLARSLVPSIERILRLKA